MAVSDRGDDILGPNAASPPKKTFGCVDWKVVLSTTGISHLSNSTPMSRSIHGKSSPVRPRSRTSSAGIEHFGLAGRDERAFAVLVDRRPRPFQTVMPGRASAVSRSRNDFGTWLSMIGMSSCWASSFSQGDGFHRRRTASGR